MLYDEYILAVAKAPAVPPQDHGAVAVIDGQTIKFTAFRTANIPPPMAMAEIEVESPAIDVAFAWDCSSMAVLHQFGVSIYALEPKGPRLSAPKLMGTIVIQRASPYDGLPLQVAYSGSNEILALQGTELEPKLLSHKVGGPDEEVKVWEEVEAAAVVAINSSFDGVIAQDHLGGLTRISASQSVAIDERFPSFMPRTSFIFHDDQPLAFGLSRNGHLYAGPRQLTKNCTSFLATPSHLIFTTSNHLVKFVHTDEAESWYTRSSLFTSMY